MKNNFSSYFISLSMALVFFSCEEVIEVNLEGKKVHIYSPANNSISSSFNQLFKWEKLKGATSYNLQLVSPSFSNINKFIFDTTVTATQFSYLCDPGDYEWRVKALNGSSSTEYMASAFTIDSTQDLSNQMVQLLSPANNATSDKLTQTFVWQSMPTATDYVFQIFNSLNIPEDNSLKNVTITTTSYIFSKPGIYKWKVYARNSLTVSNPSEYVLTIDTVHPAVPVLIGPPNDSIILEGPVLLEWNASNSAVKYRTQISTDSSFTILTKDTITNQTKYSFYQGTSSVSYYWRVKAISISSNESLFSKKRRFIIEP